MKEYRDQYLGFTYNEKSMNMTAEADFFGFIENDGNELSFFNAPDFSNEFVIPQFGDRTIYTGNTKNNRTFSLKIQLEKMNLRKYREFLEWLNPDDEGVLVFDYNKSYGYDVKVQSITNSEFHVVKRRNHNEDFYYIDLQVDFITTKDFAARWVKTNPSYPSGSLIDNDQFEHFVTVSGNSFTFHNYHNIKNYFIIKFTGGLTITDSGANVSISGAGTYFSEFGIAVNASGDFLSCGPNPLITLEPNSSKTLTITGGVTEIIPTAREIL